LRAATLTPAATAVAAVLAVAKGHATVRLKKSKQPLKENLTRFEVKKNTKGNS
jgi:hypothetical protein